MSGERKIIESKLSKGSRQSRTSGVAPWRFWNCKTDTRVVLFYLEHRAVPRRAARAHFRPIKGVGEERVERLAPIQKEPPPCEC